MSGNCDRMSPPLTAANDRSIRVIEALLGLEPDEDLGAMATASADATHRGMALSMNVPVSDVAAVGAAGADLILRYALSGLDLDSIGRGMATQFMLIGWLLRDEQMKVAAAEPGE